MKKFLAELIGCDEKKVSAKNTLGVASVCLAMLISLVIGLDSTVLFIDLKNVGSLEYAMTNLFGFGAVALGIGAYENKGRKDE